MHIRLLLLTAFSCLSFANVEAFAQAPIPAKKDLHTLDEKLKSAQNDKKDIERDLKNIEKLLKTTKNDLVGTAKDIQKNERELQDLDHKIIELEDEKVALSDKLQNDRGSIANLILALERLRRMPPEAMIVRPETPLKTAQGAMLMEDILKSLNAQAKDLKNTLLSLKTVQLELESKKERVVKAAETLKSQQKSLKTMVKKRTRLYAKTQGDLTAQQKKAEEISAQSKNLSELVRKLDHDRQERTAALNQKSRTRHIKPKTVKSGQPRLPLPGIIKTGYNETDHFGGKSQGIDIEGRAGALVVAPMGGTVQFAGFFKNYGNMVILEHEKGYHSLIAGLENIDTVVGQSIRAGEPLGVLHQSSSGQNPVLYYELRYKGKAINPAKKFGDLT